MNVKRAVAAAAGVLATPILVVALGVGYLAGHSSSTRAGTSSATHAAAATQDVTAHAAARLARRRGTGQGHPGRGDLR